MRVKVGMVAVLFAVICGSFTAVPAKACMQCWSGTNVMSSEGYPVCLIGGENCEYCQVTPDPCLQPMNR